MYLVIYVQWSILNSVHNKLLTGVFFFCYLILPYEHSTHPLCLLVSLMTFNEYTHTRLLYYTYGLSRLRSGLSANNEV